MIFRREKKNGSGQVAIFSTGYGDPHELHPPTHDAAAADVLFAALCKLDKLCAKHYAEPRPPEIDTGRIRRRRKRAKARRP